MNGTRKDHVEQKMMMQRSPEKKHNRSLVFGARLLLPPKEA